MTSKIVKRAKTVLNCVGSAGSVKIVWTKAHVGTIGNEIADQLAKTGGECGIAVEVGLPNGEMKKRITNFYYDCWTNEWTDYKGGRMSKVFYKSPDKQKAKYILKLSSYNAGRMVRLFSGHNNLGYFQNLLNPDVSPTCRLCEEETETFEHWITELSLIHI